MNESTLTTIDIENVGDDILSPYNGQFRTDIDYSGIEGCTTSTCWNPNENWSFENNTLICNSGDVVTNDNINHPDNIEPQLNTTYIIKLEIFTKI